MRKITILAFLAFTVLSFASCKKNKDDASASQSYSLVGKVQKGPFVTGTNVTVNELNQNFSQTGKSFTATITTDDGSFGLDNIALSSPYGLLSANGFFFSEIYGELTTAPLTLQSIVNLNNSQTININVLTHLAKDRIEYLIVQGKTFEEANIQARTELLNCMGISTSVSQNFNELNIAENTESNAMLLAISIILQRNTYFTDQKAQVVAELTQLLSKLNQDISTDGKIDDQKLIDTLMHNVSRLNLIDIRKNIEKKYTDLGISTTIPVFEKYIGQFQKKYSKKVYATTYYPVTANPAPSELHDMPMPEIDNVLDPAVTTFMGNGRPYSMAAIVPLDSSLTIKIISGTSDLKFTTSEQNVNGWVVSSTTNEFMFKSQRENQLMSGFLYLNSAGTATIEYYMNGSTTPTRIKNISWQ